MNKLVIVGAMTGLGFAYAKVVSAEALIAEMASVNADECAEAL